MKERSVFCSCAQSLDSLLEPCVSILRKLVYADPTLRRSLAQRRPLLLTLLRGTFTAAHVLLGSGARFQREVAFNHIVTL